MSDHISICSIHKDPRLDCKMCQAKIEDVLPNFKQHHEYALAMGLTKCKKCHFAFYRTTTMCPACGIKLNWLHRIYCWILRKKNKSILDKP